MDTCSQIWWTLASFSGKQKFLTADISNIFCWNATKFCSIIGTDGYHILRDFSELRSTFFGKLKFLTADISDTFCCRVTNLAWLGVWPVDTYSPECGEPNLAYFSRKQKFSTADISHIFCRSVTKFGSVRSIGVWQVLRDSGELWSTFIGTQIFDSGYLAHFLPQRGGWQIDKLWTLVWGPAIPCGDFHRSFTCSCDVCFCCVEFTSVLCQEIGWEEHLRNELFCVEWFCSVP